MAGGNAGPSVKAGRRTAALAALCLLLAAAGRFALFDLVEFKYDEAQVSTYALNLVRRHVVPQTSILTSGGFHNPPLMVYLAALPMLFSASPLLVTGFFTALNTLAVGGLYLAARRLFGEVAALVAALLFAVGPLAVHYSRKIWAPDAMPPFTVLLFASLALGLSEGNGWWLTAALVALAVLVQLHQAAVVFIPATALLLAVFAPRLPWRRFATWGGLLAGLLGFVLLLLPYAIYEQRHQFADIRGIAGQVSAQPTLTFVPWRDLWWLTAGWNPQLFFAALVEQEHPPLTGSTPLDWAMLILGLVGIAGCAYRLWRPHAGQPNDGATASAPTRALRRPAHQDRQSTLSRQGEGSPSSLSRQGKAPNGHPPAGPGGVAPATLLLLVLLPPLVIMRSAAPVYPHYLVFLLPLLFLLVGIGVSTLVQLLYAAPLLSYGVPILLTTALLLTSLVRLVNFDRQLRVHTSGGDYGTPLRYSLQAAQALRGPSPNSNTTRAYVMATNGDVLAVYGYLASAGIAPPAALVLPDQALPLPTTGSGAYLFTTADNPAYAALQAGGAASRPLPSAAPAYTIVRLSAAQLRQQPQRFAPALQPAGPYTVGTGLSLTDAHVALAGPSGPLTVTLAWSVSDPAPFARQPIRIFVHLYNGARDTLAQQDALGEPAGAWQSGDRLLTWFAPRLHAPLTPGRYTLVAGVYIVAGFQVFAVHGPKGESLGGEIPLGSLTVAAG
ncbi:MAG TPA: glycosyltransferase family 39 protein [Chloroflexota bacterium]|nr:glycosyltransferase family 39 protein [Chloroflexota bacterium]